MHKKQKPASRIQADNDVFTFGQVKEFAYESKTACPDYGTSCLVSNILK